MVRLLNDICLEKVDELVEYIKTTDEYTRYISMREKIKENKDIMKLIDNIKILQKKAVNEEYKGSDISKIEDDIKENLLKLKGYPLYSEFSYIQEDLNETFQGIKTILENYVNSKTN